MNADDKFFTVAGLNQLIDDPVVIGCDPCKPGSDMTIVTYPAPAKRIRFTWDDMNWRKRKKLDRKIAKQLPRMQRRMLEAIERNFIRLIKGKQHSMYKSNPGRSFSNGLIRHPST